MKVKTAVLPVAGMGRRIMPLTLHQPKPMIGIVDRPAVHYAIDEIVAAGIRRIIIVTGPSQPEFKKYVEYLEGESEWQKLKVRFEFAVQEKPLGNGDAIYGIKKMVGNEPFLVSFSDDLLVDRQPPMKTMVELFEKVQAPVIVLEPVPKKMVSRYGVVKASPLSLAKDLYQIHGVVEKPEISVAPSNLTIVGRYILTSDIFPFIQKLYAKRKDKEVGLAEALNNYAEVGNMLCGWRFRGRRFDAGLKIGILKAQAYFGINHKEFGPELKKYLRKELGK